MKTCIDKVLELLAPALLAAFGGYVRSLTRSGKEPFKLRLALAEMAVAIFAGILVHFVLSEFAIADGLKSASVALAGYNAREVLTILKSTFLKKIKEINEK